MTARTDRWRFFVRAAAESVLLANATKSQELRRLWLEQAASEFARAAEARGPNYCPGGMC